MFLSKIAHACGPALRPFGSLLAIGALDDPGTKAMKLAKAAAAVTGGGSAVPPCESHRPSTSGASAASVASHPYGPVSNGQRGVSQMQSSTVHDSCASLASVTGPCAVKCELKQQTPKWQMDAEPTWSCSAMAQDELATAYPDVDLQLMTVLGKGSYGTVYKARCGKKLLAVKTVSLSAEQLQTKAAQFAKKCSEAEAIVAGQLDHINVVRTFSCWRRRRTGGGWEQRLVQELCDSDLCKLLNLKLLQQVHSPDVHLACVLQLARDIARGLQHFASKRIIHADMNPRNILISLQPDSKPLGCVAKIADFGLSKQLEPHETHLTGIRHGTPFYCAPEISEHGCLTMTSDTYSFGVMVWELYTGLTPFIRDPERGPDKLKWRPTFPDLPPNTPEALRDLILACLDPDPEQRPCWELVLSVLDEVAATHCTAAV